MAGEQDVINKIQQQLQAKIGMPDYSNARIGGGSNTTLVSSSNNTDGVKIHIITFTAGGSQTRLVVGGDHKITVNTGTINLRNIYIQSGLEIKIQTSSGGDVITVEYEIL